MSLITRVAGLIFVLLVACAGAERDPALVGKWYADVRIGTRAVIEFKADGKGVGRTADFAMAFVWRSEGHRVIVVETFTGEGEAEVDVPGTYRIEGDVLTIKFDATSPFSDGRKTVLKRVR